MLFRHKLSGRTLILIERQGQYGLFTEHGEPGCSKVPMAIVESAFDANTVSHVARV